MIIDEPARTAAPRHRPGDAGSRPQLRTTGLTVYGCAPDEAALFRRKAPRHGVTPTLTEEPVSVANVDLALGNRCISVGHRSRVDAATLRALSRAGVTSVVTRSIGCDHIDLEHARALGIRVENVAYSPEGVADHTVLLILMALRHAKVLMERASNHDYRSSDLPGRELGELTVGVVGTGRIGTAVIQRLRAFGCRLLAHDVRSVAGTGDHVPLDELLAASDVVTLHVPLTPATHHLLDRRRLGLLKPDAVVVNTARGALVDTESLVTGLEAGRLGGAALDVLEGEEAIFHVDHGDRPVEHPTLLRLHRLPNVVLTPHTAFRTTRALSDIVEGTLAGCLRLESEVRRG